MGCCAEVAIEDEFCYKKEKRGHWKIHCTSIYYCPEEILDKGGTMIPLKRKENVKKVQGWGEREDDELNFGHELEHSCSVNI